MSGFYSLRGVVVCVGVSVWLGITALPGAEYVFNAGDDYFNEEGSPEQGYRGWNYLDWTGAAYEPMTYGPNWYGGESWFGYCEESATCYTSCRDSVLSKNEELGFVGGHPSICGRAPTRAWTSPDTGLVEIRGEVYKFDGTTPEEDPINPSDGVTVQILLGGDVLWSHYLAPDDTTGVDLADLDSPLILDIESGETLYFRIDKFDTQWHDSTYFNPTIVLENDPDSDPDSDGLTSREEFWIGTDPYNPDSDVDGLLDGVEIDIAEDSGCPDPLDDDSDGDTLLDGEEVGLGIDPCNSDTDGDTIPDHLDPWPADPGVPPVYIEEELRFLCEEVRIVDLGSLDAPNANAARGRRNALGNKINAAANAMADEDFGSALDSLVSLLARIDGDPAPKDWMVDGEDKDSLRQEVEDLIYLLTLLII